MERSHLQRMFNSAKFDARTSYAIGSGSSNNSYSTDLFTHHLPSAGRPTREIPDTDLEPDLGNQADWAGNPIPPNRRRMVTSAQNQQTQIKPLHGFLAPEDKTKPGQIGRKPRDKHPSHSHICLGQTPAEWSTSYSKEYSTECREEAPTTAPSRTTTVALGSFHKAMPQQLRSQPFICNNAYGLDLRDLAKSFKKDPYVQSQQSSTKPKSALDDQRYRKELYADNYRYATGRSNCR